MKVRKTCKSPKSLNKERSDELLLNTDKTETNKKQNNGKVFH